ncbi:MAG: HAD family hydrolase [Kiritimatiellae bacterium]|nr:HAD family hydrolase [Kiritimatiellia bacterium]
MTQSPPSTILHPPIQHVVWDWNGTLLDDAWLCCEVMNQLLAARGMPAMTMERYQAIFEFPVIRYYQALGFDFEREPFEVVGTEFIQRYEQRRHECKLRPEAVAVLETLRQRGLGQSILSAYKQNTLEELLAFHRVSDFFDHILGLSDHYAADKSGQGLALMERLGLDPRSVLLVGDTTHDVEVAARMGVQVTLIAAGNQSLSKLQACGVPMLGSLEELLARIR